jgi:two-component system sensor histidine kinase VicK
LKVNYTDPDNIYTSAPFQAFFKSSPRSLVMKADMPRFTILAVSDQYLHLVNKERQELLGKGLFDVFPGNESDPSEQFSVASSFHRVINKGLNDELPVFKYEIYSPETNKLETYYWSNLNEPILSEEGEVAYLINTTANITNRIEQENALKLAIGQVEALSREQALYEELAVANEELEAANEEIIAINEELELKVTERTLDLVQSESRVRSILKQATAGIMICMDRRLLIESVNDAMLTIIGKSAAIVGKPFIEALPELGAQGLFEVIENVYSSGITFTATEAKIAVERAGSLIDGYFNFSYQAILEDDGQPIGILIVATDVTLQVQNRIEKDHLDRQLMLAVSCSGIGTWYIQPDTKALMYNENLAEIYGYEAETSMTYDQAIGQVTEEYRSSLVTAIDEAIASGGEYDVTFQQRRFSDDKVIWLRSIGKIVQDEKGEHTIFSGVVIDITAQKQEEQRKNDFISMVSHELKTPLTSMGGYIQILLLNAKKSNDPFTINLLNKANHQIKKMATMINGFLNVSRLESGHIYLEKSSFDFADLLKEIEQDTAEIQFTHRFNFEPGLQARIFADRNKIGQVIDNLMSNAVKYAPGATTITVSTNIIGNTVQLSIKDLGPGIRAEDQPKLFERFYRVENEQMGRVSGFGIGLYLSAEIIKLHLGRMWVESEIGKGSTFYFSLPLDK